MTYTQLVSKTRAYPDSYGQEATQRGTIVTIDYDTRDYAGGTGAARTNTAQYLAERISAQGYTTTDFYIWVASGTSDSAYSETLWQIQGMARLTDTFTLSNMTFHEKDGARHEFRPTVEYIYNALPFFFLGRLPV